MPVFDTEPLLAFYLGERGANLVESMIEKVMNREIAGYLSVVNLTELYYILYRLDPAIANEKELQLRAWGIKIVPVIDDELWKKAAELKAKHRLSLADAFAAATAAQLGEELVVGMGEEFKGLGIKLRSIRS